MTSPTIAGLSIANVTGGASGATTATLTLATGAGYGFNTPSTLAVRVRAAAHSGSTDLTSATLAVSPTPGVTLSRRSLVRRRGGERHAGSGPRVRRRRHGKLPRHGAKEHQRAKRWGKLQAFNHHAGVER